MLHLLFFEEGIGTMSVTWSSFHIEMGLKSYTIAWHRSANKILSYQKNNPSLHQTLIFLISFLKFLMSKFGSWNRMTKKKCFTKKLGKFLSFYLPNERIWYFSNELKEIKKERLSFHFLWNYRLHFILSLQNYFLKKMSSQNISWAGNISLFTSYLTSINNNLQLI